MRNMYIYGHLKKYFGAKFRLNVNTPGEAIRLLNANFPGFERKLRQGYYHLVAGPRRHTGDHIGLGEIEMGLGRHDFHLGRLCKGFTDGLRAPMCRGCDATN